MNLSTLPNRFGMIDQMKLISKVSQKEDVYATGPVRTTPEGADVETTVLVKGIVNNKVDVEVVGTAKPMGGFEDLVTFCQNFTLTDPPKQKRKSILQWGFRLWP